MFTSLFCIDSIEQAALLAGGLQLLVQPIFNLKGLTHHVLALSPAYARSTDDQRAGGAFSASARSSNVQVSGAERRLYQREQQPVGRGLTRQADIRRQY